MKLSIAFFSDSKKTWREKHLISFLSKTMVGNDGEAMVDGIHFTGSWLYALFRIALSCYKEIYEVMIKVIISHFKCRLCDSMHIFYT